jgi:hypothetical protein
LKKNFCEKNLQKTELSLEWKITGLENKNKICQIIL